MEYHAVDERMGLKRIFREPNVQQGMDFGGTRFGANGGL